MAQKKIVPAKSKPTKPAAKAQSKAASVTSAKSKLVKKASPASKPKAATKPPANPSTKKSAPVVKSAATPVKAQTKAATPPKSVEKKPVAQKPQPVAAAPAASAKPAAPAVAKPVQTVVVPTQPKAPQAQVVAAAARPAPQQPARSVAAAVAKPLGQKISAPAAVVPAPAQDTGLKKPVNQRHGFKKDEFVVYPAHGVGKIVAIEEQEIAGMSLELFVISFEKDKMTLRVPTGKLASVGMRKLAEEDVVRKAMETLKGRARIKRTMWSRRAQEYEAKINSGDLVSIAEVVRDLYRSEQQPEQSYSERQLYEAALDRMAREIAAVDRIDDRNAVQRITEVLSKSAKGRRLASEAAESADVEADADADEVKAA